MKRKPTCQGCIGLFLDGKENAWKCRNLNKTICPFSRDPHPLPFCGGPNER